MPLRALATILLLATVGWPVAGPAPDLSAAYPNPVFDEDEGEFVVLDVPDDTQLSAYELTDGEDTIRLPSTTHRGELAIAANASAAELAGYRVLHVDSFLSLSNSGETITLQRASDGTVVDSLTYERASESELHTDSGSHPIGETDHQPASVRDANVTAFVLPDETRPIHQQLETANKRVLLGGYTLTSTRVRDALVAAANRGVEVRVLIDGAPVGGDVPAQVTALDALTDAGIDVRLIGGPRARYAFHHAKYAVVDDAAIVVTENWKASGTGGHGNRGWGMIVHDQQIADELAAVFRSDADWRGTQRWPDVREPASRDASTPANGSYPRRFDARRFHAESVTLAVTPDNGHRVVTGFIVNASNTLRVQQVQLGDGRLSRRLVDAAERGVEVEILLSGKWYVRGENRVLADCLNGYAERAGIPLSVRVVEPRSRFGKVHAKVSIADGERVLLGSLNWNQHALERNREVIVVAEGADVGRYYSRVFRADWRGGAWRLPWSVLGASVLAVAFVAWFLSRTIVFDSDAVTGANDRERVGETGRVWVDSVDDTDENAIDRDTRGQS